MSQETEGHTPFASEPVALSRWKRFLFCLMGGTALGLGVAAVFVSSNSIGTGILLAVGGIFLFMGITGFAITRAEFGGARLDMKGTRILERNVEEVAVDFPTDVKETLADVFRGPAVETANRSEDRVSFLYESAKYDREVAEALLRISGDVKYDATLGGQTRRIDALVGINGKKIAVEIKFNRRERLLPTAFDRVFSILGSDDTGQVDGVLLITNSIDARTEEMFSGHRRVGLVRWVDSSDDAALRSAITQLAVAS